MTNTLNVRYFVYDTDLSPDIEVGREYISKNEFLTYTVLNLIELGIQGKSLENNKWVLSINSEFIGGNYSPGSSININSNDEEYVFSAVIVAKDYNITYKKGAATTGDDITETIKYGTPYTFKPATAFTYTNFVLSSWSLTWTPEIAGSQSTASYNPDESISAWNIAATSNIIATAQWSQNIFDLTYNGNGNYKNYTQKVYAGTNITIRAGPTSAIGWTFLRWSSNTTNIVIPRYTPGSIITMPKNSLTLYAIWQETTATNVSLSKIRDEFNRGSTTKISFADYYNSNLTEYVKFNDSIPKSGPIKFSNFISKSTTNPSELMVWYKFNNNSSEMLLDSSGNGYTLINNVNVTQYTDSPKFGNAYVKSTSIHYLYYYFLDQPLSPPNIFTLSPNGYSISVWIKDLKNSGTIFKCADSQLNAILVLFYNSYSSTNLGISIRAQDNQLIDNKLNITTNIAWIHIVMCIDIKTSKLIFYKDKNKEIDISVSMSKNTIKQFQLGGEGDLFECAFDDFRFYSKVLTQAEVTAIYNGTA